MDAVVRKHTPAAAAGQESRDALVMRKLLRSVGLRESEYEPLVVHQLVEVARRYAGDVLVEARAYAGHAGRASLQDDDVRLAIRAKAALSPGPPRREVMLDLARNKNTIQLPRLSENYPSVRPVKPQPDQVEEIEDADEGSNPKPNTEGLFATRPGSCCLVQGNLAPESVAWLRQDSEEAKQIGPESSSRTSKKQKQKQQPSQGVSSTTARRRRMKS